MFILGRQKVLVAAGLLSTILVLFPACAKRYINITMSPDEGSRPNHALKPLGSGWHCVQTVVSTSKGDYIHDDCFREPTDCASFVVGLHKRKFAGRIDTCEPRPVAFCYTYKDTRSEKKSFTCSADGCYTCHGDRVSCDERRGTWRYETDNSICAEWQ